MGELVYDEDWSFVDSLFMTVITLTTVGYGDVLGVQEAGYELAMYYTMGITITGMGAALYVVSMVTAFVVEGELKELLWSRKMDKWISSLKGHYIVCGLGRTGLHILRELSATGRDFVVVEQDPETLKTARAVVGKDFPIVIGDAADDDILVLAGIGAAGGFVTALQDDRDNLHVTITARRLNPDIRIVSKGVDQKINAKLTQVGADSVVSPNLIGGLRMVSELVRPDTVSFLDVMLRDVDQNMRFEDLKIATGSDAEGKALRDLSLQDRFGVITVGMRNAPDGELVYCPSPDSVLEPGATLVVLGGSDNLRQARQSLGVTN